MTESTDPALSPTDGESRRPADPTRRTILQAGALAGGALALPASLAARAPLPPRRGSGSKVTIVLFQRGGADALNLYAPTGDSDYANLRPTIGLGHPGSGLPVEGLAMTPLFSMHPALASVHAAFGQSNSRCAVVHAVGYQPYNRSHFTSQDLYETALGGITAHGWINRHLQVTAAPGDAPVRALALRGSLPKSLFGAHPAYAVARTDDLVYRGAADAQLLHAAFAADPIAKVPAEQHAYASQQDTFALLEVFSVLDPDNYQPANGAAYPGGSLAQAFRQIAEVVKAGLGVEFFTVDQGGWDHHAGLVAAIEGRAADLDGALGAFFTDLGALADDVVVVTMSEFGRTAGENGSAGTDHGAGGAMLLWGGPVVGGQVHGVWPGLAPGALVGGDLLAPVNDYRDVLREVLDVHMGGTDPAVVFPNHVHQPIGVM